MSFMKWMMKKKFYTVSFLTSCSIIIAVLILLHDKFLQFDWLRAVVFQLNLTACENYKPFAGSSINK